MTFAFAVLFCQTVSFLSTMSKAALAPVLSLFPKPLKSFLEGYFNRMDDLDRFAFVSNSFVVI